MLPHENGVIAGIRHHLGPQLKYCQQLLSGALVVIEPPFSPARSLPAIVGDMTLGLHVRLCRKFRQALHLTAIGQADGVELICRSMFEASMAQAFICRRVIKLKYVGGGRANLHGKKLTQEFRAYLFRAHSILREDVRFEKMASRSGLKRLASRGRKDAERVIDDAKKSVGTGWTAALKRSNTCAGVSVADLAFSLGDGFFRWYRTLYAIHSGQAHPGEFQRFLIRKDSHVELCFQDELYLIELGLCYSAFVLGLGVGEIGRLLDQTHKPYVDSRLFDHTYPELKKTFARVFRTKT